MAAIRIDKHHAWVVAKWATGYVLERVNLSEVSKVLSKQISEAVERDSGYLSLEKILPEDRALFEVQVKLIAENLIQSGPNSLATPIVYESLLKNIRELQFMLEQSNAV